MILDTDQAEIKYKSGTVQTQIRYKTGVIILDIDQTQIILDIDQTKIKRKIILHTHTSTDAIHDAIAHSPWKDVFRREEWESSFVILQTRH